MKTKLFLFLVFSLSILLLGKPAYAGDGPLFLDATLRGRVTDGAGNPIRGVYVTLIPTTDLTQFDSGHRMATDDNGNFEMTKLPPNNYVVKLSDPYLRRYAMTYYPGTLVPGDATKLTLRNDEVVTINPTMTHGGKISGQVLLEDGRPISGLTLSAFRHVEGIGWIKFDSTYADNDNRFEMGGLPTGPYRVSAYGYDSRDGQWLSFYEFYGGESSVEGGWDVWVNQAEITTVNWTMRDKTLRLSGRVVDANGQPLADIRVMLYDFNPSALPGEEWLHPTRSALTDADGHYSMVIYQNQHYKVGFEDWRAVYTPLFNGNMPTLGGAPVIAVTDSNVSDVDVTMNKGGGIRGRIVSADNTTSFRNEPYFHLSRWNEHDAFLPVYQYQIEQDDAGNFTITGLTPGDYRLHVSGEFYHNIGFNRWYGGDRAENAAWIRVELGEVTQLEEIVVGQDRGVLRGQVVDEATNRPLSNIEITLYTVENEHFVAYFPVDSNGQFEMRNLPAGEYTVYVADEKGRYLDSADSGYEPDTTVTISENQTLHLTIALVKGGEINGQVWKTLPLTYVSVSAYQLVEGEWRYAGGTGVGGDGWYKISGLPAGDYTLFFHGTTPCCDTFMIAEEFYGDVTDQADATVITLEQGSYVNDINTTLGNHLTDGNASHEPKAYGSISGQISDDNQQPLANVEVFLFRQWTSPRGQTGWADAAAMVVTDANGHYRFDDIGLGAIYTTGNFRLGFDGAKVGYETTYYGETTQFDEATVIVLTVDDPHTTTTNTTLAHIGCQISSCR